MLELRRRVSHFDCQWGLCFEMTEENWRKCELAWGAFLSTQGHAVTALNEAIGNHPNTNAPLITVNGNSYRAPDFHSSSAGKSEYWEVKYRTHMDVDPLTGEHEFWVEYDVFRDYAELSSVSQTKVWIVVYCKNFDKGQGQWLRVSTNTIKVNGRRKAKLNAQGESIDSWVWPVDVMELVSGPSMVFDDQNLPTDNEPKRPGVGQVSFAKDLNSFRSELEVLCQAIGLDVAPQYSVLALCSDVDQLDLLAQLPMFGVRLFIFGPSVPAYIEGRSDLEKFVDARLIEYGPASIEIEDVQIVDGLGFDLLSDESINVLREADKGHVGRFNFFQYAIVHASAGSDLLVTAGAGTGKTETMSERIMYLLSTFRGVNAVIGGSSEPEFLTPRDISLVTFTREAAKEMRKRIARVMILRQRLCTTPIQPINAWLMQLSQMDISTIHKFAKQVLQDNGAQVGLSPDFKVSRDIMSFRRDFNAAISPLIGRAYSANSSLPPLHDFQNFVERIWQKLENHGFDLIDLVEDSDNSQNLVWLSGHSSLGEQDKIAANLVAETMGSLAPIQRLTAKRNQTLTTNQLVPTALQSLTKTYVGARGKFKYLFVDEFQDTDSAQIDILVALKKIFYTKLFVVGDKKQGIYKFRGAQGDALTSLALKLENVGFLRPEEYILVKNFRSGAKLLSQMHPIFDSLGKSKLLDYQVRDRLLAGILLERDDSGIQTMFFSSDENRKQLCLEQVRGHVSSGSTKSMAILTRENKQAEEMQSYLRKNGQPCVLVVGGGFYQSNAVREAHTFLTAVLDPWNSGLIAQVIETRWGSGLCREFTMQDSFLQSDFWLKAEGDFASWKTRLALANTGKEIAADLLPIQQRLFELAGSSMQMSFLDWFVKCLEVFKPESTQTNSDDDYPTRLQYAKNVEHLITQIDQSFLNSAVTVRGIRDWLGIKIATDTSMDEPMLDQQEIAGIPIAITVHKSKGLEFDTVLLPFPEKNFRTSANMPNAQTIVRNESGKDQVLWKWKSSSATLTNVSAEDQGLWASDDREIIKEEARLLYVAITRAANSLIVFRKPDARVSQNSWLAFIDGGSN
jgi:DNA helicase-2/ATP-dependent DNA helicase PcrA